MSVHADVAMPVVRALLAALQRQGVDGRILLREAEIDAQSVGDSCQRLPLSAYDHLQETAYNILQDPAFGLHLGEQTLPVTLGVMGHLLLGAPTVAQGIELFCRYQKLLNNALPSTLVITGERAIFTYRYPDSTALCNRIRAEFGMVQMVKIGQTLLNGALPHLQENIELHFEHATPDYLAEYHRIFGSHVHFNKPTTALIFRAELLHVTVPQPDPLVIRLLEDEAQRQIAWLERESPVTGRVEHLLFVGLQAGKPSIREVATQLAMNERTLRRKLESEQTSYSELLNKVQHRLAEKWLASPQLSIEEIAAKLQFSEPSAFYRAFKRWTGKTPAEFREHHALAAK